MAHASLHSAYWEDQGEVVVTSGAGSRTNFAKVSASLGLASFILFLLASRAF